MLESGLLSVTFRQLSASRIIALAVEAKLATIEWGGDVHVPHGNVPIATEVARQTGDAGLRVSAYGSYYRAGDAKEISFEAVLDSTSALGTQVIRVWAGRIGSAKSTSEHRAVVTADLVRCCNLAAARAITVAMEFHRDTLTDTTDSPHALIEAVDCPNFGTLWQPPVAMAVGEALEGLNRLRRSIVNIHVFHWWPDAQTRRPLAEGADRWKKYLTALSTKTHPRTASLEFVADNDIEQFRRDAETLRSWLDEVNVTTVSP